MVTLKATPDKIRFQRDGFCIFSCKCSPSPLISNSKFISAKGHVVGSPESLVGQEIEFSGEIEKTEYGYTIAFSAYTVNESVDFFWTNVSGIPKKSLDEIFRRFGRAPDWLDAEDYAAKLSTVSGVKAKTIKKVMSRWAEYQGVRKLMEYLAPHAISQKQIARIYRHFGEYSIKVLSENPYKLTDVRGIGFQRADAVALKLGISERSEQRKVSAISYALDELASEGNTISPVDSLYEKINEILLMSDGMPAFSSPLEFRSFVFDPSIMSGSKLINVLSSNEWVSHEKYHRMDSSIFNTLAQLKLNPTEKYAVKAPDAVGMIGLYNDKSAFKLGEQQQKAVFKCLVTGGIVSIVGYAGTGKSTVSRVVIDQLVAKFGLRRSDVICCALSGVATARIKKQSGYAAETIHSLLGYDGQGFERNEDEPLSQKIVLLDEAGMVDTWLFYSLLKAIDFNQTKLLILGDPKQLMPVGAGQPFIDLLNSGLLPYVELTEIFRQSPDKALPLVAESIRNGQTPEILDSYVDVNFHQIYSSKGEDRSVVNGNIKKKVLDIAYENRWRGTLSLDDANLWNYASHLQVITPRKTATLGAEDLSAEIRTRMLPSSTSAVVFKNSMPLTIFDKVIHLRNENMPIETNGLTEEQVVRVYNGQIGVVVEVNVDEKTVTVRYPLNGYSVTYDEGDVLSGLIGYAWALSIHKTQGAEFNHVVLPLTMSHFKMLNNRLLYTAVTRMKESIDIVGEKRALVFASTNNESVKRMTVLRLLSKRKSTN